MQNDLDDRITQKYLRRYPDSKRTRSWAGVMVHIETENGVWREGGSGYTYAHRPEAWVLPFEEAQRQVSHCGPEKRAAFIRAKPRHLSATVPAGDGELVERLLMTAVDMERKFLHRIDHSGEDWRLVNPNGEAAAALLREAASRLSQGTGVRDAQVLRLTEEKEAENAFWATVATGPEDGPPMAIADFRRWAAISAKRIGSAEARIKALEEALREIASGEENGDYEGVVSFARSALQENAL